MKYDWLRGGSKQQTQTERAQQTTLLAWARSNLAAEALSPAEVRRGRVASWKLDFGIWKGYTPMQLALAAAEDGRGAR